MFKNQKFLLIQAEDNVEDEYKALKESVLRNEGTYEDFDPSNSSIKSKIESTHISQVICSNASFEGTGALMDAMIPIATPQWVVECEENLKLMNPKFYNPYHEAFMSDTFVCIAEDDGYDNDELYEFVKSFGGQFLSDLTRYTTHLVSKDNMNDKYIIATSISEGARKDSGRDNSDAIDIKVVSHDWLYDCLGTSSRKAESSYLLSNTYSGTPIMDDNMPSRDNKTNVFKGLNFYIHNDFGVSERFYEALYSFIHTNGGNIIKDGNGDYSIYIGRYRTGELYDQAVQNNLVIGNLKWIYYTVLSREFRSPLDTNLLHYPFPKSPLKEFNNLKICLTNYSGDARTYLSQIIKLLGGTFTKTLTKANDILIAAAPFGKKYDAAVNKWKKEDGSSIYVLNHIWLEECFASWTFIDYKKDKYKVDNSLRLLGRVHHIFRSTEDGNVNSKRSSSSSNSKSQIEVKKRKKSIDHDPSKSNSVNPKEHKSIKKLDDSPTSANSEIRKGSRSAKQKAVNKLHSDISQLNEFLAVTKSVRKMQSFMQDLEKDSHSKNDTENMEDEVTKVKIAKKSRTNSPTVNVGTFMKAIMTGCEKELTLSKTQISKLEKHGIKVVPDYFDRVEIDTLVAPKILRTAKFLTSLSKVKRILHPDFFKEVLIIIEKGERVETKFDDLVTKYSLDKILGKNVINAELGIKISKIDGLTNLLGSDRRGNLFRGMSLNLSSNLNGGTDVILAILKAHGLEKVHIVTSSKKTAFKPLLSHHNNKILIVHVTKDKKLIDEFKSNVIGGIAIEWDWCVKSIFSMTLQPYEEFMI